MTELELRELLAQKLEQHLEIDDDQKERGSVKFLRSDEPLNDFYTGVIEAMRETERLSVAIGIVAARA